MSLNDFLELNTSKSIRVTEKVKVILKHIIYVLENYEKEYKIESSDEKLMFHYIEMLGRDMRIGTSIYVKYLGYILEFKNKNEYSVSFAEFVPKRRVEIV